MSFGTDPRKTIAPAAALLGALGVVLFDASPWGVNATLFVLAATAALFLLGRVPGPGGRRLAALAIACSAVLAWRDSAVLRGLAGLALAITLQLAYLRTTSGRLTAIPVSSALLGLALTLRAALTGPARFLRHEASRPRGAAAGRHLSRAAELLRGLLLSIPLLLVFGWLLVSADARFERFAGALLDFEPAILARRAAIFAACFWGTLFLLLAGLLRGGPGACDPVRWTPPVRPFEALVALLALDLLFASYIGVQFTYFFGGDALVRSSEPLTYAAYARRGFFELVGLTALAIPLLLLADWLTAGPQRRTRAAQKILAGSMIAMLALIEASALHRMALYTQAFGLTELRLYTSAFMLWLLLLLAWIAASVLRDARERFFVGACTAALAIVGLLVIVNPDARIAQFNLERAAAGRPLDLRYLLSLSDDAVPVITRLRRRLDAGPRQAIEQALLLRALRADDPGLRGWNWSRREARRTILSRMGLARP